MSIVTARESLTDAIIAGDKQATRRWRNHLIFVLHEAAGLEGALL